MSLEVTVITDLGRNLASDRRYRRSERINEALALQCGHVQEALGLEAMLVSDEAGDRWVGSGDRALCRLLARSAPVLSSTDVDADFQYKALALLRSDLDSSQVTTYALAVPGSASRVFVTGAGRSRMRDDGVVGASAGVRRILGFTPQRAESGVRVEASSDPEVVLNTLIEAHWLRASGQFAGYEAPARRWGATDDAAYAPALQLALQPAFDALGRGGLVVDDPWRRWRWRSNETAHGDGEFVRTLSAPVREPRTQTPVGTLYIGLHHRHDRFAMVTAPRVAIRWR
jgi:hypothetical protein